MTDKKTKFIGYAELTQMMDLCTDEDVFVRMYDLLDELRFFDHRAENNTLFGGPERTKLHVLADILRQFCYITRAQQVNPRGVEIQCLDDLMERNGKAFGRIPE